MQETPKQEEKTEKKIIEISLGKIIVALIVIALVIGDIWLGIYAYKLRTNKEENINNNSIENTINE